MARGNPPKIGKAPLARTPDTDQPRVTRRDVAALVRMVEKARVERETLEKAWVVARDMLEREFEEANEDRVAASVTDDDHLYSPPFFEPSEIAEIAMEALAAVDLDESYEPELRTWLDEHLEMLRQSARDELESASTYGR